MTSQNNNENASLSEEDMQISDYLPEKLDTSFSSDDIQDSNNISESENSSELYNVLESNNLPESDNDFVDKEISSKSNDIVDKEIIPSSDELVREFKDKWNVTKHKSQPVVRRQLDRWLQYIPNLSIYKFLKKIIGRQGTREETFNKVIKNANETIDYIDAHYKNLKLNDPFTNIVAKIHYYLGVCYYKKTGIMLAIKHFEIAIDYRDVPAVADYIDILMKTSSDKTNEELIDIILTILPKARSKPKYNIELNILYRQLTILYEQIGDNINRDKYYELQQSIESIPNDLQAQYITLQDELQNEQPDEQLNHKQLNYEQSNNEQSNNEQDDFVYMLPPPKNNDEISNKRLLPDDNHNSKKICEINSSLAEQPVIFDEDVNLYILGLNKNDILLEGNLNREQFIMALYNIHYAATQGGYVQSFNKLMNIYMHGIPNVLKPCPIAISKLYMSAFYKYGKAAYAVNATNILILTKLFDDAKSTYQIIEQYFTSQNIELPNEIAQLKYYISSAEGQYFICKLILANIRELPDDKKNKILTIPRYIDPDNNESAIMIGSNLTIVSARDVQQPNQ